MKLQDLILVSVDDHEGAAPLDGTSDLRVVDVGDYLKDGADIVTLEDLPSLKVQFVLPERHIDRLRIRQLVELSIDALPGRIVKGRVQAVDSQVDPNGRAQRVLPQVANSETALRPGMFARPRVVLSVHESAVVVPEEALVPLGAKQFVFKVFGAAQGRPVAQRIDARLGLRLPGKIEILEGIKVGDTAVTAGHLRLLRGDSVPMKVVDIGLPGDAAKPGRGLGKPTGGAGGGASGGRPAAHP